jgi:plastocyanin
MWFRITSGAAVAPILLFLVSFTGCTARVENQSVASTESTGTMAGHNEPAMLPNTRAESAVPAPIPEAPTEVVIDNFTYSPAKLTVAKGAKVTWINHDDVPHTVTSTSKPRLLDSPTLDTDDKFSFVFTKPGVYEYFCAVHPKMTGQVVVK